MNEVVIKIKESGVTVEQIINSVVTYKSIDPDSLLECIKRSIHRGEVCSGLLPRNCLSFVGCDDGSRNITILHPEDRADIRYYGTEYKIFPLMRCVFGFGVSSEGRISNCRLGVISNERPRPTTPMFVYPFGNVNGFNLCTGNNVLPPLKSFHTMESLTYHLLSLSNNNDYFKAHNNRMGLEQRDLLEFMKDKSPEVYYSDVLVPCASTLNDFISGKSMEYAK
jgi:hypothetical protein